MLSALLAVQGTCLSLSLSLSLSLCLIPSIPALLIWTAVMSRLHNWHPLPHSCGPVEGNAQPGSHYSVVQLGLKCTMITHVLWVSSGRCLLLCVHRSFVRPKMLCFWDYIRFFFSEEDLVLDLDLLVSTLSVCWALIFVTDSSQRHKPVRRSVQLLRKWTCLWIMKYVCACARRTGIRKKAQRERKMESERGRERRWSEGERVC